MFTEPQAAKWRTRQDLNLQPLIRSQMLYPIELRVLSRNEG